MADDTLSIFMNDTHITRRDFLGHMSRGGTAGALLLQLPWLATLAGCAGDTDTFAHLSGDEARTMRAFAAQILPSSDGTPGAEEAGAVQFIDRALGQPFFAGSAPVIRAGLADLDTRARERREAGTRAGGFASLSGPRQIEVMRQIEHAPFFNAARALVLIGTFADSSYGGNRAGAGWAMIGMEHRASFAAPYGWYDAQPAAASTKSAA